MAWLALVAGAALQAIITAVLGLSLTPADSLLLLAFAAAACALSGSLLRRRNGGGPAPVPTRSALCRLNLWTALTYVAFFLGVAAHGAPVVFTLEASLAPIAVLVWTWLMSRRGNETPSPRLSEWAAAGTLAALGVALVPVLARDATGGLATLLVASALGVVCGIAAAGVVVVSRELGRDGLSVRHVMSRRFYVTLAITLVALAALVPSGLIAPPRLHFGVALVAAIGSIVVPLYLLQYAMQRLNPTSITAALATIPALSFVGEFVAGRAVSGVAVLLSLLIVPASLALLIAQRDARPRTSEHRASTTPIAAAVPVRISVAA